MIMHQIPYWFLLMYTKKIVEGVGSIMLTNLADISIASFVIFVCFFFAIWLDMIGSYSLVPWLLQ